jgi:hypothetical protein
MRKIGLLERKAGCEFTRICSLYSNASETCIHTGGQYCGKYRNLSRQLHQTIFGNKEENSIKLTA